MRANLADEIIVHIGLAKTGTTAIQNVLLKNKQYLLEQHGILFPGLRDNHFHLQSLFSETPHLLLQMQRNEKIDTPEAARAFLVSFKESFESEIAASGARTIVISSEYFSSMAPDELAAMYAYLRGFARNMRIIAYIRDPWSHSLSILQQFIRDGYRAAPIRPRYSKTERFIDKSAEAAGMKATVRPFLPRRAGGGDVVEDFMSLIGVSDTSGLVREAGNERNESISRVGACILAGLNLDYPRFTEDGMLIPDPARDWMVDAIIRATPGPGIFLSKATAAAILDQARPDLECLHETYFDGAPVFFDAFEFVETKDEDDTIDPSSLTKQEIVDAMTAALQAMAQRALNYWESAARLKAKVDDLETRFAK